LVLKVSCTCSAAGRRNKCCQLKQCSFICLCQDIAAPSLGQLLLLLLLLLQAL
jgi:hypothetical protein